MAGEGQTGQDGRYELALKVVDLAKAQIVSDNHFLSSAIGQLVPVEASLDRALATDARFLFIDPGKLLAGFVEEGEPPERDLLHTILHCVFLHPFVDSQIRADDWDLACDMACELLVMQICGPREDPRGTDIDRALKKAAIAVGESLTAERIYAVLRDGTLGAEHDAWAELFAVDDHSHWYSSRRAVPGPDEGEDDDGDDGDGDETSPEGHGAGIEQVDDDSPLPEGGGGEGDGSRDPDGDRDQDSDESADSPGEGTHEAGVGDGSSEMMADAGGSPQPAMHVISEDEAERTWRKVGKSMSVDLRTISRKAGGSMGALLEGLDEANRQTVDYRDFLRKFAVPSEVMRVSPDEYDMVFYTYGLSLYGNMPLIEPLENRIDKRIRDFVIALDTSSSVYGEEVRRFVALTYDILKSTETFDERVHVKIVQCDTRIRHIDDIDSLGELRSWCGKMRIYGGGGTDFRPVFELVDQMVDDGELRELGGLIYFTDGYGTYPEWVPGYKTAFVFCDDEPREETVPNWAMQVVIEPEQLDDVDWRRIGGTASGAEAGGGGGDADGPASPGDVSAGQEEI